MDPTKLVEDLLRLQKAHTEDEKLIDELKTQNQRLKKILEEYNAALSRCIAILSQNRK